MNDLKTNQNSFCAMSYCCVNKSKCKPQNFSAILVQETCFYIERLTLYTSQTIRYFCLQTELAMHRGYKDSWHQQLRTSCHQLKLRLRQMPPYGRGLLLVSTLFCCFVVYRILVYTFITDISYHTGKFALLYAFVSNTTSLVFTVEF